MSPEETPRFESIKCLHDSLSGTGRTLAVASGNQGVLPMKVFLAWSGERSREVAEALKDWLPVVLQSVEPFVSKDIPAGTQYFPVLQNILAGSNFGIICLTKDSCRSPWLLFESGALAKVVDGSRLCPYLIDKDLTTHDLPAPLSGFETVWANRAGTWKLVQELNSASGLSPRGIQLLPEPLEKSFAHWWPDIEPKLNKPNSLGPPADTRSFFLMNVEDKRVLKARPGRNGAMLVVGSFSGEKREMWHFHQFEDYYAIVSELTQHCLDVDGSSQGDAAKIHQWGFGDGDNQKWTLAFQDEDGSYKLRAKHSGKCLAVSDGGIKQMGDSNSPAQKWWVVPVLR